jgi:hypothetical protein
MIRQIETVLEKADAGVLSKVFGVFCPGKKGYAIQPDISLLLFLLRMNT